MIHFAVYLIGFCDSLLDMLEQYMAGYNGILALPIDRINDVRLLGAVTLVLILGNYLVIIITFSMCVFIDTVFYRLGCGRNGLGHQSSNRPFVHSALFPT